MAPEAVVIRHSSPISRIVYRTYPMILNIFIIAFVLFLAYWQGLQGFFSAVLHLGLVVVSGALAFALWEPLAYGPLMGMMPRFAFAVGLVVPFVFFLLLLRFVMDKYVATNVEFSSLTNLIGGGACGAVAAILTTGVLTIGLMHLPTAADGFGVKRWMIQSGGDHARDPAGSGLWLPVDQMAAGFFSYISDGSFAPFDDKPLAHYRPDLAKHAQIVRVRPDPNSSITLTDNGVTEVNAVAAHAKNFKRLLPALAYNSLTAAQKQMLDRDDMKVVQVTTKLANEDGVTYDGDPRLRLPPNQVALVSFPMQGAASPRVDYPALFSMSTSSGQQLAVVGGGQGGAMWPADKVFAEETRPTADINWYFIIPQTRQERFVLVRYLRFEIDATQITEEGAEDAAASVMAERLGDALLPGVGTVVAANTGGQNGGVQTPNGDTPTPKDGGPSVGPPTGNLVNIKAEDVEITGELPVATSKNLATQLTFDANNQVRDGKQLVQRQRGPSSSQTRVTQLYVPSDQAMVRIRMSRQQANSFLGQAVAAAAALHPLVLEDNKGNLWPPIAYVWLHDDQSQTIDVRRNMPFKAVTELPYQQLGNDDSLYVYFLVNRDVDLIALNIGTISQQTLVGIKVPQ